MPPHGRRRRSLLSSLVLALCLFLNASSAISSVLGVDLGTEYIKAALVKPGIPLEIVLTKDSKRKEAAAVIFKPGRSPSSSSSDRFPERLYGGDALALAARFPGDVYSNMKPLLGLGVTHPMVEQFKRRYPGLQVQPCTDRATVCFRSVTFGEDEALFTVEELLAMELQNIRANAEAYAGKGSVVKDIVVTMPAFYTVEEKRAVEAAAEMAGLNILAMTTDGLAIGLNYATTRTFPVINEGGRPEYHLIFDMGAGSATATVLKFQGRTVKDVGRFNKTVQEVHVMGVGWDKSLGGDALNAVILDDLVEQFAETKKMKALGVGGPEIKTHGRTMAKLWKETERMRQVLSANSETQASFEGLYDDDVNFKYKISRTKFEKLAAAHEERVKFPLIQALDMAKLELDDLESIIVHGGAIRTPFVQKALESLVGKPAKIRTNVNSDEAAAFGAAFKAAGLSPSFRVKEIRASEAATMLVTVSWVAEGREKQQKLFVPTSLAGFEKQIPLKVTEDFSFSLSQQSPEGVDEARTIPVSRIESTNLTASVTELKEKYGCEVGGITAQFSIRLSPVNDLPEVTRGSVSCEYLDTGKIGGVVDGVKGLFGFGSKKDGQEVIKESESDSTEPTTTELSTSSTADPESTASKAEEKPKVPEKKKAVIPVGFTTKATGLAQISSESLLKTQNRMSAFDKSDLDRKLRSEALNTLEAYTYRVRDIVDDESFVSVSTEQQRSDIQEKSSAASEWLYGDGADAKTETLKARLKEIQDLVNPIQKRKDEASKRPDQVKALQDAIEQSKSILKMLHDSNERASIASVQAAELATSSRSETTTATTDSPTFNLDDLDDEPVLSASATTTTSMPEIPTYTPEDIQEITTAYETAEKWLAEKLAAQGKLALSEEPVILSKDLKSRAEKLNKITTETLLRQMPGLGSNKKPKSKTTKSKTKAKSKSKKTKSAKSSSTATAKGGEKSGEPAIKLEEIKDEL